MGNSEKFRITYILIAVNIAFYIYTSVAGGDFVETSNSMIGQYGQNPFLVFRCEYYRLTS